jgi:hypothetical protein
MRDREERAKDKFGSITFLVPGQEQPGAALATMTPGPAQGQIRQTVQVAVQSGGGEEVRVVASAGLDVVVLEIANGPALVLHPESARDLMLAQGTVRRSRHGGGMDPVREDNRSALTSMRGKS